MEHDDQPSAGLVPGHSRRQFLGRLGAAAGVVTIGSALVPVSSYFTVPASAADDSDVAAFVESLELTLVEAYKKMAASGKVTLAAVNQLATTFVDHHNEHAQLVGALKKIRSQGVPNSALLSAVSVEIQTAADEKAAIKILYDLENAAAATHFYNVGALTTPEARKLAASILPVESQHAAALGTTLAYDLTVQKDFIPTLQDDSLRVDPTKFPAA